MKMLIGRAPDCDLVVNHACVSSKHASMQRGPDGVVILRDEGSSNGTFLNQPSYEIRETSLNDDDIIFLSEEYKIPGSLLLKKFAVWEASGGTHRSAIALGQVHRYTDNTITIGSAAGNLLVLPYLNVWPQHAIIHRSSQGGYILQDLGGGCMVNGARLVSSSVVLQPNDAVELGGVVISTSFDPACGAITIGAERRGFYLTAKDVTFTVPGKTGPRALLDQVNFSVLPGEFVGLLGPSGCGKTTLLTCMSGVVKTQGVYYNGMPLEEYASANAIGYVPQDDVLYPELTVRETLYNSARLRLNSHTSDERILAKIDEVCEMLGLIDRRSGLDLRDTLIGSPDRKTLSGGQKKRVNLAMELLTDPLVLFLDEPTSGLSSQDTRVVMECLRRLADEKGIAIIITIHQPSLRVYKLLDHTLYLKSGKLAYFGPAYPDSVLHFVRPAVDSAGADEVMEMVDETDAETLRTAYQRTRYFQKYVKQREELVVSLTRGGDLAVPRHIAPLNRVSQTIRLLLRQLKRRSRDLTSLAIQIGQAPALGLLAGFAFETERMNSPLFLLTFIALWFGANATARELVSERVLFKREKRGGTSSAALLIAKMSQHGLMLFVQCLLLLLTVHMVIELDLNLLMGLIVLWLCGMCGAAIGLLISGLARTEIAATAATPLVLIPLILFGGYLTLYDDMPKPIKALSQFMPSRWGYEALVNAEKLNHKTRKHELEDPLGVKRFLEFSQPKSGRLTNNDRRFAIWKCIFVLTGGTLLLAAATWITLKRQN